MASSLFSLPMMTWTPGSSRAAGTMTRSSPRLSTSSMRVRICSLWANSGWLSMKCQPSRYGSWYSLAVLGFHDIDQVVGGLLFQRLLRDIFGRNLAGGQPAIGGVELAADDEEVRLCHIAVEGDELLLDPGAVQHDDGQRPLIVDGDQLQVLQLAIIRFGQADDRHVLRRLGQQRGREAYPGLDLFFHLVKGMADAPALFPGERGVLYLLDVDSGSRRPRGCSPPRYAAG